MSWYRWLLTGLLLVCVDGAWAWLALGVLGFLAGLGQPPLSLALVQALLVGGGLTRALHDIVPAGWPVRGMAGRAAGVAAVWLAVAAASLPQAPGLGWPVAVLAGELDAGGLALLALAALPAAALWRHGARRLRGEMSAERIGRSFRAGLAVFVVVLLMEAGGGLDLGTAVAIAPFFVTALAGMALARAPNGGAGQRRWLALVAGCVGVVVAGGVALAVVGIAALRGGGGALRDVWVQAAAAFTEQVDAMLADWLGERAPGALFASEAHASAPPDAVLMLVLLVAAALVAWLAGKLLDAQPQDLPVVLVDLSAEERESLPGADSPARSRIVEAVAARWRRPRPAHAPPPPGSAVAQLHRRMLALAGRRGVPLNPAQTPFERAAGLRRGLPEIPVDDLTRHFVAERYGGRAPPAPALARIARALDGAEAAD